MDINKALKNQETIEQRIKLAKEYKTAREKSYKAHYELDILLVGNLREIRADKPNVGIDFAYIMLMEICEPAKECYKTWKKAESQYKGMERILSAVESKTTFCQSLMRYERTNS